MSKIVNVVVIPDPRGKGDDIYKAIYDNGKELSVPRYSSVKKIIVSPALRRWERKSLANILTQEDVYKIVESNLNDGLDAIANALYTAIYVGTPEEYAKESRNIGSEIHKFIEHYLSGHEVNIVPNSEFYYAWQQFLSFANAHTIEVVPDGLECPLVSEKYLFGGRVDMIARVDGILSIVDWKTSGDIYNDYIVQISCYAQLWNENHPNDQVQQGIIVRVPKKEATEYVNKESGKITRKLHKLLTITLNDKQLQWIFANLFLGELLWYNFMKNTTTYNKLQGFVDTIRE